MIAAVMSFQSSRADRILRGDQRVEFRRRRPQFTCPLRVYIYEPAPVQRVAGLFHATKLLDVPDGQIGDLEPDPEEAARIIRYLAGSRRPTAILVGSPQRLPEPRSLTDFGLLAAPQFYTGLA